MDEVYPQGHKEIHRAVQEARIEFYQAQKRYQKAREICQDTGFHHPDGAYGLRLATSQYLAAMEGYTAAVSAWRHFLVEEPSRRDRSGKNLGAGQPAPT